MQSVTIRAVFWLEKDSTGPLLLAACGVAHAETMQQIALAAKRR